MNSLDCEYCDYASGPRTWKHQVGIPVNGKVCQIDHCIHRIVAALNAANIRTVASCCGHGQVLGNIALLDGRMLVIHPETPKDCEGWKALIGAS